MENPADWALNVFGIYSLLLMNKYLGVLLNIFKSIDSQIYDEAQKDLKEKEKEKEKENQNGRDWDVYRQVKTWLIAASGVTAAYVTGTTSYLLQLLSLIFTIISNLPMFTRVGAPFLCIVMKLYGFKLRFLRGWLVLSLSIIAVLTLRQLMVLNFYTVNFLLFALPSQTFIVYHLSYDELMDNIEYIGNRIYKINYYELVENVVEEIVTNG
mmetsp:Transcript_22919/g.29262  ORF Transcript_22919/g.29262 Transcript_22919/m.29262 type:complete len:211 (-) Transcript_22919:548-1180(-)